MFAAALKDKLGKSVDDVIVNIRFTDVYNNNGTSTRYDTPPKLGKSLKPFDELGKMVPPGEYTFYPPKGCGRIAKRREYDKRYAAKDYVVKNPRKKPSAQRSRKLTYTKMLFESNPGSDLQYVPPAKVQPAPDAGNVS